MNTQRIDMHNALSECLWYVCVRARDQRSNSAGQFVELRCYLQVTAQKKKLQMLGRELL